MPKTWIIAGPPAAGKTTYVMENSQDGDLVLDLDLIAAALSGMAVGATPDHIWPYVWAARDGILRELQQRRDVTAWIITSKRAYAQDLVRMFKGRRVDLVPPQRTIAERMLRRGTRVGEMDAAREWYNG